MQNKLLLIERALHFTGSSHPVNQTQVSKLIDDQGDDIVTTVTATDLTLGVTKKVDNDSIVVLQSDFSKLSFDDFVDAAVEKFAK